MVYLGLGHIFHHHCHVCHNIGNSLIEAVNILGSLFYGVILGIFLVAFWIKIIKGNAVFYAAIISELLVILIYNLDVISSYG